MFSKASRSRRQIERFCAARGAALFGVADISGLELKADIGLAEELRRRFDRAVCFGVGLSEPVLSEIEQEPTKLYFHHYRTANMFLDQLAFAATQWIRLKGFSALPIPASQIVDWEAQKGHLSHKKMGFLAGLGWIGRNNLLVSKKFGAQFRLATILTDMPLEAEKPGCEGCGSCFDCVAACPVGAIQDRPEDFKHLVCFEKLKDFQKQGVVGQFICGICVKACGRKA